MSLGAGGGYPRIMLLVVAALLLAGFIGGFVTRLKEVRDTARDQSSVAFAHLDRFAVAAYPYALGVAAAACVPLFLSTTRSTLLQDADSDCTSPLILFGLALCASLFAKRFLDSLSQSTLALEKAESAERKAEAAIESTEEADALAQAGEPQTGPRENMSPPSDLDPDASIVLAEFYRRGRWAPSMRGLLRAFDWDEGRIRRALGVLTAQGLLQEMQTTQTRRWVRWALPARRPSPDRSAPSES